MKEKVLIIGGGLAGLSLGYFLEKKGIVPLILEKSTRPGGLCKSFQHKGFLFDQSGHFLHFRDSSLCSFTKEILSGNLLSHHRLSSVYSHNRYIPYPFQRNFNHLPKNVVKECLAGLNSISCQQYQKKDRNLLTWFIAQFGRGLTHHFFQPYNEKFWKLPLTQLTAEWCPRFIPPVHCFASEETVSPQGYNARFWYPDTGGIEALINAFSQRLSHLRTESCVTEVDLLNKRVLLQSGEVIEYEHLVSTLPLPELGKTVVGLPYLVQKVFENLRWLSIYNLNIGINASLGFKNHWIYFPQEEVPFFRLGFYHNFSQSAVPQGQAGLYIDCSYQGTSKLPDIFIRGKIEEALYQLNIVPRSSQIICTQENYIPYAYPVYDYNYQKTITFLNKYLLSHGVFLCGRFGSWQYLSMEDVMEQSRSLANMLDEHIHNRVVNIEYSPNADSYQIETLSIIEEFTNVS